ncbi:MAG TPA: tRNA (adenine(22)-N(1))-methyltransferase TrmK [Bacillota bacterium]|nr:tRNA (adenine(22)-N(1))-methyltransferase TrmK [Bacillota bacterium]
MEKRTIQLSKRLQTVASFLSAGTTFADIGSDHAYLPCYVCLRDSSAQAIAGEVNVGPYKRALKTVQHFQLEQQIDVRLGSGLSILRPGEVCEIVIAGMGGSLIRTILEEGKDNLAGVERIIAQPNIDERSVRRWLTRHRFLITYEKLIEENGHFYEVIVADQQPAYSMKSRLSEKALLFGPKLLERKSPLFVQKWKGEYKKRFRLIQQMKQAQSLPNEKIVQLKKEIDWIEEVLKDG